MRRKISIGRMVSVRLFVLAATVLMIVSCNSTDPSALESIVDLGPFEEFAEYKTVVQETEPGKRDRYSETPKLVLVVRPGLSKADLGRVANAFMRARPSTEIDIFDIKERLDNYVNLNSFDPRSSYKAEMTFDDDFMAKHLLATVRKVGNELVVNTDRYDPYKFSPKRSPAVPSPPR